MAAKIAVVTGANKGIGYEIARKIAGTPGHTCILAARNEQLGRSAADKLTQEGFPVVFKQLDISDAASVDAFKANMESEYGKVDVLVNNAAIAFKGSDPTPFRDQAKPTFDINFFGTVDFTEKMLPLVRKAGNGRIVNVASMSGHLRIIPDAKLRDKFTSESLTKQELRGLASQFVENVKAGTNQQHGWPNSCYGMSKLCVIAYTRILARELRGTGVLVNALCPGYVATDMSSYKGHKTPEEGARTPYLLACKLADDGPTGQFWQDEHEIQW